MRPPTSQQVNYNCYTYTLYILSRKELLIQLYNIHVLCLREGGVLNIASSNGVVLSAAGNWRLAGRLIRRRSLLLSCACSAITAGHGRSRRRNPPHPPPQYLNDDGVPGHPHAEPSEGRKDDGYHGLQMELQFFFRITDSAQCTRWSCNLICSDIEATWIWWGNVCTGLICAYISVKQMGEEHDEEELYCRVDPNVSSCHCNDVWIMDPLQQNQACNCICGVVASGCHYSYPCLSLSMKRRAPGYMRRAAISPAQQYRHGPPVVILAN